MLPKNRSYLLPGDPAPLSRLSITFATLLCLTFCGLARGRNPEGALNPGLLRTVGTEHPAGWFISIDSSPNDGSDIAIYDDSEDLVRCMTDQLFQLPDEPT